MYVWKGFSLAEREQVMREELFLPVLMGNDVPTCVACIWIIVEKNNKIWFSAYLIVPLHPK